MMYKIIKLNVLFFALLGKSNLFAENKIVYLISPPRSLSVAFLRMMEARGDFIVMNEPSLYAHNRMNKSWFYKDTIDSVEAVKQFILSKLEESNVFVKEMVFSVKDFLLHDKDFVQNENVYFIFLVRNPHHSMISMYKKALRSFRDHANINPYRNMYELFKYIQKEAKNAPLIIKSEDLYENTLQAVERFCQHVGIENKEEALSWQDLGEDFTGKEAWHEIKHKDKTYHWHGDAIRSSGFTTPHVYAVDQHGLPTFQEIIDAKDREILRNVYNANLIYYNLMLEEIN